MASDYVMYLSIVLVGSLAIAGISVTMVGMNDSIEDRAIKTNLEHILNKISESIHTLKSSAYQQIELGASNLQIHILLELPPSIKTHEYLIEVTQDNTTQYLTATSLEDPNLSVSLNLLISPDEITITGEIESTGSSPVIIFRYLAGQKSITLES